MENTHNNKDLHVRGYIAILTRRKWTVISFFAVTVALITWMTFKQTPIYRASSTIIVDVQSPDILAVKDIIKLGETNYFAYKAYIETQQEIIKSRRIAYRVMKNLGLRNTEEFAKAKDPLDALLKKLKVELVRDTRILKINVEDESPKKAANIANEFAKVYVNSNIALKVQASSDAEGWLKDEVEKQKAKVRDNEIALQDYKEKNDIVSVANKENIINDALAKLNSNYVEAQRKKIKAEAAYKSLVEADKASLELDSLSKSLPDNEIFMQLKKEYLSQQALLVEYQKVYKNKHPKMIKLLENIAYLESRIKNEVDIIKGNIKAEYEQSEEEEMKLKSSLEDKKKEALDLERRIIGYNALKRELDTNERILDIVLNRLKETSISQQIQTNNVRVQDLAEVPRKPVKPRKQLNVMFSVILGMIGGIGLALFREYMDITIKDSNDIVTMLQLPILGSVPRIKPDGKNIKSRIDSDRVVEKDPLCMAAEAYRSIRTNLLFSIDRPDDPAAKTIIITSSVPREGKTISAINLAIMMANSGERVLLVDSDMRRPRVHTVFNMHNDTGFSNHLSGQTGFENIIRDSGIENLSIITAGSISHKSAELIASKNTKLFLEKARAKYSKIIFDAPPIALVTDAAVLSNLCDGVVLIAEANRTTKGLLNNSKELLHKAGGKIIGVVLNNVSLTRNSYYYPQYYYGKYYKPLNSK